MALNISMALVTHPWKQKQQEVNGLTTCASCTRLQFSEQFSTIHTIKLLLSLQKKKRESKEKVRDVYDLMLL